MLDRVDKTERWGHPAMVYSEAARRRARVRERQAKQDAIARGEAERRAAVAARWQEALDRRAEQIAALKAEAAAAEARLAALAAQREEEKVRAAAALRDEKARLAHEVNRDAALLAVERLSAPKPPFPPRQFIRLAAHAYGMDMDDIFSDRRMRAIVKARQVIVSACSLAYPAMSLPQLGNLIGRDHTTILHALRATGFYTRRAETRALCRDVQDVTDCLAAVVANAALMGRQHFLPPPSAAGGAAAADVPIALDAFIGCVADAYGLVPEELMTRGGAPFTNAVRHVAVAAYALHAPGLTKADVGAAFRGRGPSTVATALRRTGFDGHRAEASALCRDTDDPVACAEAVVRSARTRGFVLPMPGEVPAEPPGAA